MKTTEFTWYFNKKKKHGSVKKYRDEKPLK